MEYTEKAFRDEIIAAYLRYQNAEDTYALVRMNFSIPIEERDEKAGAVMRYERALLATVRDLSEDYIREGKK